MSSRRRGREKRNRLDPIETAFAEAAAAVARRDVDRALVWSKVAREIEAAERKCDIHRRERAWLERDEARGMARLANKEKEIERRWESVDERQDRVNRLAAELRILKARLQLQAASKA